MILYFDTETYNVLDVTRVGAHRYAEDPSLEIMVASWAVDDGPAQATDHDFDMVKDLLLEADTIVAHNSTFDRLVVEHAWGLHPGSWLDTAVQAQAHGLPAGLGLLCQILGVDEDKAKIADGRRLINKFCKPAPKGRRVERYTKETDPDDWALFLEYARNDIEAMREVHRILPQWNYPNNERERKLWVLDQEINDRGMLVDVAFAEAASAAARREKARLARETKKATGGEVGAPSQRDAMLEHILSEYGVELPDLRADTLRRRVNDPSLPEGVRRLMSIRLESVQTSTAKYDAVLRHVSEDGRMRGTLRFAGASRTARWGGSGFQPQNLKRPDMKPGEIEIAIAALKEGCEDLVVGNVMDFLADGVRGLIISPDDTTLCAADLSNIEGRVLTCLAQEHWKLKFFRDYDAGLIEWDNYQQAYARSFNVDPSSVGHGDKRQIGKVQELFLGYGGGVGAFLTGAATYNINLDDFTVGVMATATQDQQKCGMDMYSWAAKMGRTHDLPPDVYSACEIVKAAWREAHPATVQLWADLESNISKAIQNPGRTYRIGKYLAARADGSWLRIRLPSGRYLCYLHPRVDSEGISYMGMNQYTRKWEREYTFGGKAAEQATQAVARDVLAEAMPKAEDAGYRIIMHVHDELISESNEGVQGLIDIMSAPVGWMPDLPLAAAGYEATRYKKD